MGRKSCNKEVEQEVADIHGVPVELVRELVRFQSQFTKEVIESNSFDGVRFIYLGKFVTTPRRIQMRNEYNRNKKKKTNNE